MRRRLIYIVFCSVVLCCDLFPLALESYTRNLNGVFLIALSPRPGQLYVSVEVSCVFQTAPA